MRRAARRLGIVFCSQMGSFSSGGKDLVSALGRRLSGVVVTSGETDGVVWSPSKEHSKEGGSEGRWGEDLDKAPLDRLSGRV